ncbi:hypothetical protein ABTK22_19665, partial [Acinetobacter baumannii]
DLRRIQGNAGPAWLEAKAADKTGVVGLKTDRGRCRSHTSRGKTVCQEAQPLDSRMPSICHQPAWQSHLRCAAPMIAFGF